MDSNLLDVLVDRGIISEGTGFIAKTQGRDLCGANLNYFTKEYRYITHQMDLNGIATVLVEEISQGHHETISAEIIESVDGMPPKRLASIYNISDTGQSMKAGARRGRKPKKLEEV